MDVIAYQPRQAETIKSVTLADLQFGRPSPFDRVRGFAKTLLMLWGALTFGAAAGTAGYYFVGAAGEPVLVSQKPAAQVAVAEIPPPAAAPKIEATPAPLADARLPRPRPDEPIFTGSIERPAGRQAEREAARAPQVQQARARYIDPCEALDAIGARFIFGMRCQREARVYAPPPPARLYYYEAPAYQPAPYQPPYVVR